MKQLYFLKSHLVMIHLRKTTLTMKKTGNCVGTHVQKRARTKENPHLRKDVRARVRVIVCVCVCGFPFSSGDGFIFVHSPHLKSCSCNFSNIVYFGEATNDICTSYSVSSFSGGPFLFKLFFFHCSRLRKRFYKLINIHSKQDKMGVLRESGVYLERTITQCFCGKKIFLALSPVGGR